VAMELMTATVELQHEIEQFYYGEAELLDEWRYREWLDLFSEDTNYWLPTRKNRLRRQRAGDALLGPDGKRGIEMAHFDDDKESMGRRVAQRESGTNWAEDPPSRTRHLITNVRIKDLGTGEAGASEYAVRSNFLCYRNRLEAEVDLWAGQRDDVLRRHEGSFLIAGRTILLDQNVILSKNLSVFF
jgi:biphenyl 2,3-dioxygenase subunit beta